MSTRLYFLLKFTHTILLLLLLSGLFACSTEGESPIPAPPEKEIYFEEVTQRLQWNRKTLADHLGLESGNALLELLPDKDIIVEAINYWTETPDQQVVLASGIITYPANKEFRGVVISEHFTIASNEEAPSSTMATIESALALYNYLVITPDYLGFGATKELPQTYLSAKSAGRVSVDMVWAVREYMHSMKVDITEEPLQVIGYSQGGFSALAFARMVETYHADEIKLAKIFAGGGPYQPSSMFSPFVEKDEITNPATVLLTITGLDYAESLGLDYTNVFLEPLLSNYKEWCISKKYTLGQINKKLGTNRLSKFLHPDMFTPSLNEDLHKIVSALDVNDLTDWIPRTPILLVHGTKDQTVPYVNAEKAYQAFHDAGSNVRLIPVEADHTETAPLFYLQVLLELR